MAQLFRNRMMDAERLAGGAGGGIKPPTFLDRLVLGGRGVLVLLHSRLPAKAARGAPVAVVLAWHWPAIGPQQPKVHAALSCPTHHPGPPVTRSPCPADHSLLYQLP